MGFPEINSLIKPPTNWTLNFLSFATCSKDSVYFSPKTSRWHQWSLAEELKGIPPIFGLIPPRSLSVVGPARSWSASCCTTCTLSVTMYSPHLRRASFCHFLHATGLFISSARALAAVALLSPSFRLLSLAATLPFIFWPLLFIGSLISPASTLTLLNSILWKSSISFLYLAWPFLSLFASAPGLLKNIKKASHLLSFLFLFPSLCVVPFLSVYVSLCPTDHPVGPWARLY